MKDSCVAKSYFVIWGAVDIAVACMWVEALLFLIVFDSVFSDY